MDHAYSYLAVVSQRGVIDGDSVCFDVDLGFSIILKNQNTRLFGIDAAETRRVEGGSEDLKKLGLYAKAFVQEALPLGTRVTLVTYKDRRGKFGRLLAEVYLDANELSLNQQLVEEKLAVSYFGQDRKEILAEHYACVEHHLKLGNI